mmetsp:Transcript_15790/g.32439  ORF Transcript_15790/g.32439 Transcript_15790/m.32439 type:complete len:180 (-) Transcript_15790:65-604(-)
MPDAYTPVLTAPSGFYQGSASAVEEARKSYTGGGGITKATSTNLAPTYTPNPSPSSLAATRYNTVLKYYHASLEPYLLDAVTYLLLTKPNDVKMGLETFFMATLEDEGYLSKVKSTNPTSLSTKSTKAEDDAIRNGVLSRVDSLLTLAAAEAVRKKPEGREEIIKFMLEQIKGMKSEVE